MMSKYKFWQKSIGQILRYMYLFMGHVFRYFKVIWRPRSNPRSYIKFPYDIDYVKFLNCENRSQEHWDIALRKFPHVISMGIFRKWYCDLRRNATQYRKTNFRPDVSGINPIFWRQPFVDTTSDGRGIVTRRKKEERRRITRYYVTAKQGRGRRTTGSTAILKSILVNFEINEVTFAFKVKHGNLSGINEIRCTRKIRKF